jgi:hypothetical protein
MNMMHRFIPTPITPTTNVSGDILIIALDRRDERFRPALRNWLGDGAAEADCACRGLRYVGGVRFGSAAPPFFNIVEGRSNFEALAAAAVEHFRRIVTLSEKDPRPITFMLRLAPAEKTRLDAALDRVMLELGAAEGSA